MDAKPQPTMPKVSTSSIGDPNDEELEQSIDWLDLWEKLERDQYINFFKEQSNGRKTATDHA